MKGLFAHLGWIMFLLLAVLALLFYNVGYLPEKGRADRLQQEIGMWTGQVSELTDSLRRLTSNTDTAYYRVLRFEELFARPESLVLTTEGKVTLREIANQLRTIAGRIEITGYADAFRAPGAGPGRTPVDFAAAMAAAVGTELVSLGVPAERILVCGSGKSAVGAGAGNRRVEIAVLSR